MGSNQLNPILDEAIKRGATDIHLVVGRPPIFRIHGELNTADSAPLTAGDLSNIIFPLLTDRQKATFEQTRDLDFSYFGLDKCQFRVNVYHEKGNLAATFRIILSEIKTSEELNLPDAIEKMVARRKGLIIFSGQSGSGKSTSMSFLINKINATRRCKIITIEDPIEFIHKSNKSLIVQREVGADTGSFASALKYSLRQDPDVVVVGEMRDLESISMALTTAETGHLVISTVHAPDAIETINRIIDVYPAHKRDQIFIQLAENIIGVVAQMLAPRKDKEGRVLVTEVLMTTMAIRNMIRRGALVEVRGQLDAEQDSGAHTFEASLSKLYRQGIISFETAREFSTNPHHLKL